MKIQIAVIGAGLVALSANANVVVNGGFESAINPANGWTQSGAFVQSAVLAGITPHSGGFMASSQGGPRSLFTGTMSQVLTLNVGDTVNFELFYQDISSIAEANLTVTLGGTEIYNHTVGATSTPSWQQVAVSNVVITSANPTLLISVVANSRNTIWLIDDVSVTVVPAPASAMLGLGMLGLAARRRR